jgi:hypothetical protein
MTLFLPDANVLIYALHDQAQQHARCRKWLVNLEQNEDALGLCELTEVALIRIATLPRFRLVPMDKALHYWRDSLWTYPFALRLAPGDQHIKTFSKYIEKLNLVGNDVNDAWLAALAVEHRATLVSFDEGFGRFADLSWLNLAESE